MKFAANVSGNEPKNVNDDDFDAAAEEIEAEEAKKVARSRKK